MVVLIESVIFVAKLKYVRENPNINPFAKTITPVTKKQKYVKGNAYVGDEAKQPCKAHAAEDEDEQRKEGFTDAQLAAQQLFLDGKRCDSADGGKQEAEQKNRCPLKEQGLQNRQGKRNWVGG